MNARQFDWRRLRIGVCAAAFLVQLDAGELGFMQQRRPPDSSPAAPLWPMPEPTWPRDCCRGVQVAAGDWEDVEMQLTPEVRNDYEQKFGTCTLRPARLAEVDNTIARIMVGRARYAAVAKTVGSVPWYMIGIIHSMECGSRFSCHLHNGDPLTARTRQEPKNRPAEGEPPFTWEESAADALRLKRLDTWSDWSIGGTLYQLERYNGFGYRAANVGIPTPYLWAGSQHYSRGKYVRDHVFDPHSESTQIGAAVLLRRMLDHNLIELPAAIAPTASATEEGSTR